MSARNDRTDALGRPLGFPLYVPNRMTLDASGERLIWDDSCTADGGCLRQPSSDMLGKFIMLANVPKDRLGKQVFAFAKRFGPLRLCRRHQLPASHNYRRFVDAPSLWPCLEANLPPAEIETIVGRWGQGGPENGWYQESVADWQRFARQADAIITIAGELRARRPGDREQWAALATLANRPTDEGWAILATFAEKLNAQPWRGNAEAQRSSLAEIVNVWLQWGEIRTQLDWAQATAKVGYALPVRYNLFGTLALHLAATVSATRGGLARCTACHSSFIATRKPASGRNTYCPDCGRTAANRDAKRRQRKKQQRRAAAPSGSGDIAARHPQ